MDNFLGCTAEDNHSHVCFASSQGLSPRNEIVAILELGNFYSLFFLLKASLAVVETLISVHLWEKSLWSHRKTFESNNNSFSLISRDPIIWSGRVPPLQVDIGRGWSHRSVILSHRQEKKNEKYWDSSKAPSLTSTSHERETLGRRCERENRHGHRKP